MKEKIKKWLKPVLFTAGGAFVGLASSKSRFAAFSNFGGWGCCKTAFKKNEIDIPQRVCLSHFFVVICNYP